MKKLITLCCLIALSGCGKHIMTEDFTPVGELSQFKEREQTLDNFEEVAFYYKSAPDGFTLRENELQVSEGYDHEILGEIKIYHKKYSPGVLSWIFSIPTFGVSILAMQNRMFGSYDRNLLINDLKKKSFEKGGNAVIYALTNVTGDGKFKMNTTAPLARGWSVKVAD